MGIVSNIRTALSSTAMWGSPPPGIRSPWSPSPSHLESLVWSDLLDRSVLPLTRAEALTVPAVARARQTLAASIARMPLRAWRGDEDVTPIWLIRTDRDVHPWHRMIWTIDDLIFYGWSLWQLVRNSEHEVIEAVRVRPDRWSVDERGAILVDGAPVHADDACLIPGPDEGVLTYGQIAIRHASKLIRAADRASDTPTPTVNLHQTNEYKITDDERDKLIAGWAAARRGENGGVAFTSAGIDAKEMHAIDAHLLTEGRNAAAVDVARVMGVPATVIDAATNSTMTYENVRDRAQELIDYGLAPYMSAITARLSLDDMTARGTRVRFDTDRLVGAVAEEDTDPDTPPAPRQEARP